MEILYYFVILFAFLCGIGATLLFNFLADRRALSIVRTQANRRGLEKQEAQADRLMACIGEATQLFKEAKDNGEDLKTSAIKILPQLALKYPDVAIKYAGQFKKMFEKNGGLGGINIE